MNNFHLYNCKFYILLFHYLYMYLCLTYVLLTLNPLILSHSKHTNHSEVSPPPLPPFPFHVFIAISALVSHQYWSKVHQTQPGQGYTITHTHSSKQILVIEDQKPHITKLYTCIAYSMTGHTTTNSRSIEDLSLLELLNHRGLIWNSLPNPKSLVLCKYRTLVSVITPNAYKWHCRVNSTTTPWR